MKLGDLSTNPNSFRARKRAVEHKAHFLTDAGVVETREGQVRYEVGDALVTGIEGERWPVPRERFFESYLAVAPTRMGEDGRYTKIPRDVWALCVDTPIDVDLPDSRGMLHARPGYIIVQNALGDHAVIGASIFEKYYERIK